MDQGVRKDYGKTKYFEQALKCIIVVFNRLFWFDSSLDKIGSDLHILTISILLSNFKDS